MAFQATNVNSGQERQNRKLLEQLEEQKKRLRLQANPSSQSSANSATGNIASTPTSPTVASHTSLAEPQHMTTAQRAALQHAHTNSVGYFITQDSSFGNLILPVIPRFDK